MGSSEILRPDNGSQPILCAICKIHDLIFIVKGNEGHDRAKNLFLVRPAGIRQSFDHSRFDKPSVFASSFDFNLITSTKDLSSFIFSELNVRHYFLEMRLGYDGPLVRFLIKGITDS